MTIISSYFFGNFLQWVSRKNDNEYVMQHVYTDDESDISFRDTNNKTDGAMKRKITLAYAAKVKQMRADKERAAQLDAFNYLNGTNL